MIGQIVLSGGRTISYECDAEERITKVVDSVDGTTEYTYNANILKSIDILSKKKYNYEYEDGCLVRGTECDIAFSDCVVVVFLN